MSGNIDLSDTSGLVPINNQTPLTSVVSSNETVASHLAPTNLSHVRLTSVHYLLYYLLNIKYFT